VAKTAAPSGASNLTGPVTDRIAVHLRPSNRANPREVPAKTSPVAKAATDNTSSLGKPSATVTTVRNSVSTLPTRVPSTRGLGAAGGAANPAAEAVATIETKLATLRTGIRVLRARANAFGCVMVRSTIGAGMISFGLPNSAF
jgi:hypothetical protein